ncbi:hypothetical protein GGX14DRAFT_396747 [Mycena pura]|uniref:Uncharacterized protein n=1 Tax=Mycena pura TaxID=153505 RepID=A0AAD6V9W3_9AGAR|nr:hypothetical protein GGX14DRAFT_396747 [Mycena pura]
MQQSVAHPSSSTPDVSPERQVKITAEVATLYKENDKITYNQMERRRLETRVRAHTDHDMITSHTMRLRKDKKPRDTITYLKRTDVSPEIGSKKSCKMAELARDYHNALQSDGLDVNTSKRQPAEEEVLQNIDSHAANINISALESKVTTDDVERALREAKPGKAGLNGIPTEFWTCLANIHQEVKAAQAKGQTGLKSRPVDPKFR